MNRNGIFLGETIKATRERMGLSQKDFAARLRVAQGTASQWEHGNIDIPYKTLCRIAEALDVSPAELADPAVNTPQNNVNTERLHAVSLVLMADPMALEVFSRAARMSPEQLEKLRREALKL